MAIPAVYLRQRGAPQSNRSVPPMRQPESKAEVMVAVTAQNWPA
jgi:hypothetical protein